MPANTRKTIVVDQSSTCNPGVRFTIQNTASVKLFDGACNGASTDGPCWRLRL